MSIVKTQKEQAQSLANYLPGGRMFVAKNISGSNMRLLLDGLSEELLRVDEIIQLFRTEFLPDTTSTFISEWESSVGIPDSCFGDPVNYDIVERRLRVEVKLAWMNLQLRSDFIALAEKFGVVVTLLESGTIHSSFPIVFPMLVFADAREPGHTIIIEFSLPPQIEFNNYEFPILFGDTRINFVQCLFNKLKPANVQILYTNI